ncbi:MAG: hypothetical protein DI547_05775 [Sphingobium sp.]|nr:MAG: hypothetical protein DI547_05775 [Sphingobium sp.]
MSIRFILPVIALITSVPALAQEQAADGPVDPGTEKVSQVIVYGDEPCPASSSGEIVVCARKAESERYRIPEELRGNPNAPANQAWGERARSIEYVGRTGTESCSPVGGGGATGCFAQIARMAKEERKQAGKGGWADLVAAERAKRLSKIDADSDAIEARVKAEEAAEAQAETKGNAATPAPADTTTPPQ